MGRGLIFASNFYDFYIIRDNNQGPTTSED